MAGDRQSRRDIEEALETLGQGELGDVIRDQVGPAVYRIHPTAMTAVACLICRHLGLIPTIPKVPKLVWECTGCGHKWALEPPASVWIEGSRPIVRPPLQ